MFNYCCLLTARAFHASCALLDTCTLLATCALVTQCALLATCALLVLVLCLQAVIFFSYFPAHCTTKHVGTHPSRAFFPYHKLPLEALPPPYKLAVPASPLKLDPQNFDPPQVSNPHLPSLSQQGTPPHVPRACPMPQPTPPFPPTLQADTCACLLAPQGSIGASPFAAIPPLGYPVLVRCSLRVAPPRHRRRARGKATHFGGVLPARH